MIRQPLIVLTLLLSLACGINSVSKRQLQQVKPGDVITFRYQKGGKSWFYADKVTRVDGDNVFYNPGKNESTAGNDVRLQHFETSVEKSINITELIKFDAEQGEERRVVIWIN